MRILILAPSAYPSVSGNAITTERWRRSLSEKGHVAEVLSSNELDVNGFLGRLKIFGPDLIHVHHAYKTAALLLDSRSKPVIWSLPMVLSPGGTDINLDFAETRRRQAILEVMSMARVVIAQNNSTIQNLLGHIPGLADRIFRVPKACCWFGNEPCDLRKMAGCNPGDLLFFLPAGIRPVKGNLECLLALEKVYGLKPQVRFVAAGPSVDAEYAVRFEREVRRLSSFARWIPTISPSEMRSAYASSDIVLNTSFSEGLSNSLLEAISAGRPILASDIPGNRETVMGEEGDPAAGLLFRPGDAADFVAQSIKLIDDPALRKNLGRANALRRNRIPDPDQEADALLAAYNTAMSSL